MLPNKSQAEFEALIEGATILESEAGLIKVAQINGKRIIKLFRRKSLLSSQIWLPYGMRFKRNADRLRALNIPTIQVESVFNIPALKRHAIIYPMLAGTSLREALNGADPKGAQALLKSFARFVADLHKKGVHFRSLHLGNVLVLGDGELGLIDVADMHFRRKRGLRLFERCRNFEHITRYQKDIDLLIKQSPDCFIDSYLLDSGTSSDQHASLRDAFHRACQHPKRKQHVQQ
jgi:hypothetical protein